MNFALNKIKYILTAGIAFIMINQLWKGIANFRVDENLRINFGTVLFVGMQLVMLLSVLVLSVIALQNLFQFYLEVRYKGEAGRNEKAQRMRRVLMLVKICASLAIRLIVVLLFILLAAVALFAPGVKNRDGGIYGAAICMLVFAVFIAYSNIRVTVARMREIKEKTE